MMQRVTFRNLISEMSVSQTVCALYLLRLNLQLLSKLVRFTKRDANRDSFASSFPREDYSIGF